jgi:pimeloyl-ACP methyl ester carboxylesterase
MDQDFSEYCGEGTEYDAEYVALPSGVSLLVIAFTPQAASSSKTIVFIPGLASVIDNFRETVIELGRHHKVVYIETREKGSARVDKRHGFSVDEITADIVYFVDRRFSAGESFVMAGYSLGATVIAEAFVRLKQKPERIILIEPNASFKFPRWLAVLARFSGIIYAPLKPFLKWYMRRFRINIKEDYEMYRINCRILDAAEPVRLGRTVRALRPYVMDGCLQAITIPSMVVVASKDMFHSHGEGSYISERIKNCTRLDMIDNKQTHSAEMGRVISEFILSEA